MMTVCPNCGTANAQWRTHCTLCEIQLRSQEQDDEPHEDIAESPKEDTPSQVVSKAECQDGSDQTSSNLINLMYIIQFVESVGVDVRDDDTVYLKSDSCLLDRSPIRDELMNDLNKVIGSIKEAWIRRLKDIIKYSDYLK